MVLQISQIDKVTFGNACISPTMFFQFLGLTFMETHIVTDRDLISNITGLNLPDCIRLYTCTIGICTSNITKLCINLLILGHREGVCPAMQGQLPQASLLRGGQGQQPPVHRTALRRPGPLQGTGLPGEEQGPFTGDAGGGSEVREGQAGPDAI